MPISETAQANHDELFPGQVSPLKVTDPDLNVGNIRQDLIGVLTVLLPFIGYPEPSTPSPRSTRSRP
jgi:hypothetical protein